MTHPDIGGQYYMTVPARGREVRCLSTLISAVILCTAALYTPASAQTPLFQPTMQDVDPGIDHGDSSKLLPEEFEQRRVFCRSATPGRHDHQYAGAPPLPDPERNPCAALRASGVQAAGPAWAGLLKVTRKVEWPDWRPPPEMIARQPYLPRFMAGSPAILSAPAPCSSARRCIASTVPTRRRRSGSRRPSPQAASRSSTTTLRILPSRVPVGSRVIVRQNWPTSAIPMKASTE